MRYVWMELGRSKFQNSNIEDVFWMNQVHMLSSVVGSGEWEDIC